MKRNMVLFVLAATLGVCVTAVQEEVALPQAETLPLAAEGPAFHIGLGGKVLGGLPFALVAARYGAFGGEVAVGFGLERIENTSVMLIWYDVIGRFYFGLPEVPFLALHMGAGAIGITASASFLVQNVYVPVSISALGVHPVAGIEVRLRQVVVSLGIDWVIITGATVNVAGMQAIVPVRQAGTGYHLGVRYDF